MIVPQYWAESRVQHREAGRQFTVRRFGWADASQSEAQANADRRAQEALQRLIAGEKLVRRERKVPYNGADGLPIREEIVSRHGATIITRNSYGARCLNTPNILFADLDAPSEMSGRFLLTVFAVLFFGAVLGGWWAKDRTLGIKLGSAALLLGAPIAALLHRIIQRSRGNAESIARRRVERFLADHPEWNLRFYRTPAGFRLMATHRAFDPGDPAVAEFFQAVDCDPVYTRMCLNQKCFRARVSAKPWRIGIGAHLRPRPGVWPVAQEHLPKRYEWITNYEEAARSFAACEYLESLGSGVIHSEARRVQELHDELSGATRQLPLA